jgi:hypothetical protein
MRGPGRPRRLDEILSGLTKVMDQGRAAVSQEEGTAMSEDLRTQQVLLCHVTRTDPDPRVRRRAHALLLLTQEHSVAAVARLFRTVPHRVRAWRAVLGGWPPGSRR